jgi:hypothetical protein
VLNQLLSDRRPAAQALLRELMLNADGSLRSDATTQQILQVRGGVQGRLRHGPMHGATLSVSKCIDLHSQLRLAC